MALTQRGNIQRVSQIAQNSTKMQTTTAPPSRSYMHRMILFPILFVAVILFVFVFKMQMTTASTMVIFAPNDSFLAALQPFT